MKNVDRDLTFGVSKPVDAKDWSKVNRITMQYFQHNPDEVKYKLSTKNFLKDITENNSKKLDELTEFKLKNNNKPVFIGIRNPSEKNKYKTNSGFQLYWFNGEKYVRIPVLGAFGMDEYQPKNYIGESILGKNIEIEQPVEGILGNDKQEEDEEPEDRFSISTGSVPKVLDSIINSNIEYYSELAKQLKPFINDGLKIGYGDSVETKDGTKTAFYGTYVWDTNNIIIHETNSIKLDDKRMAEVILEEVLHGMTIHNLNNYITLGKNGNVEVELNAPKYVTDLVQLYNDVRNTTDPQRISDVLKRIKNNEGLATNDRDIYALSDIYEFVARSLTNQDFQKFLAQDKFKQSGQSRLEKFKDFIFNVLKALGINFDKDSATVQAINSIFEFIKDTSENEKNQSISDLDMWNSIDYDDISNNDLLNKVDKFMEDEIMTDKDVDDFNKLFDGNNVEASLSPINFPDKTFDFKEEKCL